MRSKLQDKPYTVLLLIYWSLSLLRFFQKNKIKMAQTMVLCAVAAFDYESRYLLYAVPVIWLLQ